MYLTKSFFRFALGLLLLGSLLHAQSDTLRVMHYNILRYGDCNSVELEDKDSWLRAVISHYQPDLFTANEVAGRVNFVNRLGARVLNFNNLRPAAITNQAGSEIINVLFYNQSKLALQRQEVIASSLRDINVYHLYVRPVLADTQFITCIVAHLKAGSSSSDATRRNVAAQSVVNWLSQQPAGNTNYLFLGDFNISGPSESTWATLLGSPRLSDPVGPLPSWGPPALRFLTQSPFSSQQNCGVGGGLDDRFDIILTSPELLDTSERVHFVPDSYVVMGNDGNTPFNQSLNCVNQQQVPFTVCQNLARASDHLPVTLKLRVDRPNAVANRLDLRLRGNTVGRAGSWHFQSEAPLTAVSLSLLDTRGRMLWRGSLAPGTTDFSVPTPATPGFYLLRIHDAEARYLTQKLVVE